MDRSLFLQDPPLVSPLMLAVVERCLHFRSLFACTPSYGGSSWEDLVKEVKDLLPPFPFHPSGLFPIPSDDFDTRWLRRPFFPSLASVQLPPLVTGDICFTPRVTPRPSVLLLNAPTSAFRMNPVVFLFAPWISFLLRCCFRYSGLHGRR